MGAWADPGHERWKDASGAYVLGALPPGEARAYEAHLAGCAVCRAEIAELMPAVEALRASEPPP